MLFSYTNVLVLVGAVFLLGSARTVLRAFYNPLNKVPGPWHARITNLRLKFATITGRRIYYVQALHEEYGPYVRLSPDEIAVNDAGALKQIYAFGSGFEKSEWYKSFATNDFDTLFTMLDAKTHSIRRRLLAPGFAKTNIRQHWEGVIKEKVTLAVSQIRDDAARNDSVVDMLKWWSLMTNDVSSHLMFGESFRTLEKGEINEYIRVIMKALKGAGIIAELPLMRIIGPLLPIQTIRELFSASKILLDYAHVAVEKSKDAQGTKNIFAQIQAEAEKGENLNAQDVEWQALGLFVAGTDTTATTLTYLLWAVLSRPDLRDRIEKEVSTLPEGFRDADVERLPLLNAVIGEALRLYGASPGGLPRVIPPGGRDIGGYFFPQGTIVTSQAYSLHRIPQLFPDPLEFKPTRFLEDGDDTDKLSQTAKSVYMPFGAGGRACLGVHVAYSVLRLTSAEFFRRCLGSRLASSTTTESMEFENYFTIAPRAHRCEIVLA